MRLPLIIAHRGASGYEYENSRAAFRRAITMDAEAIELDVHATRDGAIVVHHDAELAGIGRIAQLTLADARAFRLPNGESLPLLADVLGLIGDAQVWVEVKRLDPAFDDHLLAILAGGPAPAAYGIHSFDHRIVRRLRARQPSLRGGALMSAYVMDPIAVLRAADASVLWQERTFIDQDLVDRVHDAGCSIIAWTVNEAGELEKLAGLGVDGLCGNFPDRIRVATRNRTG